MGIHAPQEGLVPLFASALRPVCFPPADAICLERFVSNLPGKSARRLPAAMPFLICMSFSVFVLLPGLRRLCILVHMKELPAGFIETSLTALPEEERAQAARAILRGAVCRGLRLRPGVPLNKVREALPGPYAPIPWAADAYYIEEASRAGSHLLHAAGAYYLQEPSAMAAAPRLDAAPGMRVLDLCAAPGGKSTQIAALLGGAGVLVSNETAPGRARVLSQNIERMGVPNAVVTNETPDKLAAAWGMWFDRVLVDAPCSGEGMFRRDAQSRAQWTAQSPSGCAARQARILDSAAEMLVPGGVLVYATCTFNETENEGVVDAFLKKRPDFVSEGMHRLWPHRERGEGHCIARFRRQGQSKTRPADAAPRQALSAQNEAFGDIALPGRIARHGDTVWLLPHDAPPLRGIRALRTGLALGAFSGRHFIPDHAAAMACPPQRFARHVPLDDEQAARFLRGEALSLSCADGWTVAACRGLSLGWGKCVQGTLKNHLPKGLRK